LWTSMTTPLAVLLLFARLGATELAFPPPPAIGFSDTDGVRRMQ
jgi:hypothetical protein